MRADLPSSAAEAKRAGSLHYFTGKPCKRGHMAHRFASTLQCSECQRWHVRRYYAEDPDKFRARALAYHWANRDASVARIRAYRLAHGEEVRQAANNWRLNNLDRAKASTADWKANNRERLRYHDAKRNAAERMATPPWLTQDQLCEIKALYVEAKHRTLRTGIVHHVDHIVPIQGKVVCGLNVPWNMRVVTAEVNASKGYRLDLDVVLS